MSKLSNHNELLDDVLAALRAIEYRINQASKRYAGIRHGSKGFKKYQKVLETSASQIHALKIIGYSNIAQYRKVHNLLISANLSMQSAIAQKKGESSHSQLP